MPLMPHRHLTASAAFHAQESEGRHHESRQLCLNDIARTALTPTGIAAQAAARANSARPLDAPTRSLAREGIHRPALSVRGDDSRPTDPSCTIHAHAAQHRGNDATLTSGGMGPKQPSKVTRLYHQQWSQGIVALPPHWLFSCFLMTSPGPQYDPRKPTVTHNDKVS